MEWKCTPFKRFPVKTRSANKKLFFRAIATHYHFYQGSDLRAIVSKDEVIFPGIALREEPMEDHDPPWSADNAASWAES